MTSAAPDCAVDQPLGFAVSFQAQWSDMDQNGHMRTTAYLAAAENARMQYFASGGFSVAEFARRGIGPVIQNDDLRYRAELRLLQTCSISVQLAGVSDDGARFKMRNTFVGLDGMAACTITSTGGWLDLVRRRLVAPDDDLREMLDTLPRTEDFEKLASPRNR